MDIDISSKQNSLQFSRGDWTPEARAAQAGASQTATTAAPVGNAGDKVASIPKGYESPVVKIDPTTGAAVLSFRDPGSDQQSFQVPSRSALEYERQQRLADNAKSAPGVAGSK